MARGRLIAFEGLDQSGKQTQAERLRDRLIARGLEVQYASFPDYDTHIGREISQALAGERHYPPDVMQLLYVANRYEWKDVLQRRLAAGAFVVCDRYLASSIAYGEAFGLDGSWLREIQRYLPQPVLTVFLDIAPETAVGRKPKDRDRYERDLQLQARVRGCYQRLAEASDWLRIDGSLSKDDISEAVFSALTSRLALP